MGKLTTKTGRKSILSEAVIGDLVRAFLSGAIIKDACAFAGISEAIFHRWRARGEAELLRRENPNVAEGTDKWNEEQPFVEFVERTQKARADAKMQALAVIREAMLGRFDEHGKRIKDGEWTAAAWYLERSDPENWGRRVNENKQDGTITVKVVRG